MNIGLALRCRQCSNEFNICNGVDDLGTSVNCPDGFCGFASCVKGDKTEIRRTCGETRKIELAGIDTKATSLSMKAGIDTKMSECDYPV